MIGFFLLSACVSPRIASEIEENTERLIEISDEIETLLEELNEEEVDEEEVNEIVNKIEEINQNYEEADNEFIDGDISGEEYLNKQNEIISDYESVLNSLEEL